MCSSDLFACRMDDVDAVCQRVFKRPMADLFQGDLRSGDNESIAAELARFEAEIAEFPPPDYSTWLPAQAKRPDQVDQVEVAEAGATGLGTGAMADTAMEPAPHAPPALPLTAPRRASPNAAPRAVPEHYPVPLKRQD